MENPFFRFMGRVADLMILNVVFLVCCIPVVTIGPAITALYYTTLKMVRNEESYIVKGFFHSFKQNLRQGIIINLILLAIGVLLFLDLRVVAGNFQGIAGKAMYVVIWLGIVLYALIFVYIYPLLSRFYNTIRNTRFYSAGHDLFPAHSSVYPDGIFDARLCQVYLSCKDS